VLGEYMIGVVFCPPWRQLRGVGGEEAVKAFVKAGGLRRNGKGDPVNIKMPNRQLITIPCHRELRIGLLKAAIRKAGLSAEEFWTCCEKEYVMQYTVIVHNAEEGGYWVEVPSLPGCFSQGEIIDQAMNNVKETIELHIQGLKDEGQEVPKEEDLVIGRVDVRAA
jgi:predicted RNase H-like HicB family nuclease/predicted RNA binding protein YcfA (HicA-like mRNA interferase family)